MSEQPSNFSLPIHDASKRLAELNEQDQAHKDFLFTERTGWWAETVAQAGKALASRQLEDALRLAELAQEFAPEPAHRGAADAISWAARCALSHRRIQGKGERIKAFWAWLWNGLPKGRRRA